MKKRLLVLLVLLLVSSLILMSCTTPAPAEEKPEAPAEEVKETEAVEEPESEPIELIYWQVDFQGYDLGIQAAIDLFQAEYPNIKVTPVPISYDEINQKIAVSVPVGEGPDIVQPFYGWVPLWQKSGFLAPLPEDLFPKEEVLDLYMPVVNAMYIDDQLWGLPFNQSNWAIWYNVDMFNEAGITKLPETFEELRQAAVACTKRAADGTLEVAGYYVEFGTQEHILWKVLTRKNGQEIFSEDQRTVMWNDSDIGAKSFKWLTDLVTVDKVMDIGFGEGPGQAFMTEKACMRLGSPGNLPVIRATNPDLNFDAFPLPKGLASDPDIANMNQTQYWSMNLTSKAVLDPKRAEAAYTFMRFIMRPEVALAMIKGGYGGLPAHKALLDDPYFAEDPKLAAFMETLPFADPLFWVDEMGERNISMEMGDRVILNNEDPFEVFDWGTEQEQKLRDEFFNN